MNKKVTLFLAAFIVMLPLIAVNAETNSNTNQNEWRDRWEGQGRPAEGQKGPGRGPDGAGPRPNGQGNGPGMGAGPNGMGPDQRPDGARRGNFNGNDNRVQKQFTFRHCEMFQNRINNFDNNNTPFQDIYANINTRLDRLVERLDSKGVSTVQLKSDIKILDQKIATLKSDYEKFINQLKTTGSTACNQNQNDNSQTPPDLSAIRSAGQQVRKDRQDIRDYFRNTIQPELQKIREQLKDDNSNNNS